MASASTASSSNTVMCADLFNSVTCGENFEDRMADDFEGWRAPTFTAKNPPVQLGATFHHPPSHSRVGHAMHQCSTVQNGFPAPPASPASQGLQIREEPAKPVGAPRYPSQDPPHNRLKGAAMHWIAYQNWKAT